MPTPGEELASLDLEHLIGAPLIAAVNAQSQAAIATVNFIKQVGFKAPSPDQPADMQTTNEPATVTFKYKKTVPKADGTTEDKTHELMVPFLTMLPVPYMRIDKLNVKLLAKINSVEYQHTDTSIKVDSNLSVRAGWGWGKAKLKVSAVYQRQSREGSTVTRDYSLAIDVLAGSEDMPGGLARLLSILEGLIVEKAAA